MINKEQLKVMSKFELGKTIARLLGLTVSINQYMDYADRDENVVLLIPAGDSFSIDNPKDIMPLAFEHKICLLSMFGTWDAYTHNGIHPRHNFEDENPLRAIACCLILLLQEKQK